MAFIEIGFNTKRPLILGRGGFGTQLNDWRMDEGWGWLLDHGFHSDSRRSVR